MKLYVWDEVFCAYTSCGIAFALAGSKEQARALVIRNVLQKLLAIPQVRAHTPEDMRRGLSNMVAITRKELSDAELAGNFHVYEQAHGECIEGAD